MPIDITINAIIALAYKRSTISNDEIFYCNITNSSAIAVTLGDAYETMKKKTIENPFEYSIWYPNFTFTPNYYHYLFCVMLFQFLPACLIDFMMIIAGKKALYVVD